MTDNAPKDTKPPRARKPGTPPDGEAPKPRTRKSAAVKAAEAAAAVKTSSPGRVIALVAGIVIALDQILKYVVVHVLMLDRVREIDLIDPWLNLRMAWNQGVNFGLFSSDVDVMRWILIAVAAAVCAWVWIWLHRTEHTRFAQVSAGLLIGGAIGNVIDRLTYGAVADFLNMSLPNWRNPYSFNVADIAIFLGAIGLFLQPPVRKPVEEPKPVKRRAPARDKTRDDAGK